MASSNSAQIPIIDLSPGDEAVGHALVDAAEKYGFVFVQNTGMRIPSASIDEIFETNMGWSGMHTETLDPEHQKVGDFKEAFNMGEFSGGKAQQPLPPVLADREAQLARFTAQCHNLCMRILELFALGLEIPASEGGKSWFSSRHDPAEGPSGSIFRLLYYPPPPQSTTYNPEVDLRAGAHSDYGSITLLFQQRGGGGLEILTPAGTWAPVPVEPNSLRTTTVPSPGDPKPSPPLPILVNIGDLLSFWTAGLLKSTVHRVVAPRDHGGKARYSVVYFCHPLNETALVPVPSEAVRQKLGQKDGNRGGDVTGKEAGVMTAAEHLQSRLAATYGWKGKED